MLTGFSCFDYGANISKAIEKITTDKKDYHHKCFLLVA